MLAFDESIFTGAEISSPYDLAWHEFLTKFGQSFTGRDILRARSEAEIAFSDTTNLLGVVPTAIPARGIQSGAKFFPVDALDDGENAEKDPWEGGADAWSDHLALAGRMTGPLRSGSPVLTSAANADDFDEYAMSSHPKPKPVATPTMRGP